MAKRINGSLYVCVRTHKMGAETLIHKGSVHFFADSEINELEGFLWAELSQYTASDSVLTHYYEPAQDTDKD